MGKINREEFYTTKELADRYRVNKRTIERLILDGEIPAIKIGRQYRIKGESIIKYENP
mgnify:CR=1 FL=1